jgi:Tfp pilus assembly protein PilF
MSLARLSERHGAIDRAERIYLEVLREEPLNQQANHRLGVIAVRNGQFAKAEQHLQTAAKSGPASPELLNDIGYTLYMMDRLPEAEATLRRSLEMSPKNEQARNNLALVLGASGRYGESLSEFKAIVGEAEAYANLGYIKTQQGDIEGAISDYSRALSLDSTLRPAAEALLQLSKHMASRRTQQQSARTAASGENVQSDKQVQVASHQVEADADQSPQQPEKLAGFFEVIERPNRKNRTNSLSGTAVEATGPATAEKLSPERVPVIAESEQRPKRPSNSAGTKERVTAEPAEIPGENSPSPRAVEVALTDASGNTVSGTLVTDEAAEAKETDTAPKAVKPTRFQPAEIVYGRGTVSSPQTSENDDRATQPETMSAVPTVSVTPAGTGDRPSTPAPANAEQSQSTLPTNWGTTARYELPTPLTCIRADDGVTAASDQRLIVDRPTAAQSGGPGNGQEAVAAVGPTNGGPLLFQPANNWQRPTWVPSVQGPASAPHVDAAPTSSLQLTGPQ